MSELIWNQLFSFIVLFFCGVAMVILRQFFLEYKKKYKPMKGISFFQEMLFWFFAGLLVSACLYYAGFGAITFHGMLSFTLGIIVWYNIERIYR
ncbi:MAG: hypothetical protein GX076_08485 [Clostridiales bacterium]|nr:hypothetical protein [Clostridiales bacterium]